MQINTPAQAMRYMSQYIPKDRNFKFPGELGLDRTAYLLKLLDEPQNKLKVIHVAGTSGKGSTSFLTSVILRSLGFKVGLCVSPILLDTRERFQINNKLISESDYYRYLSEIIPHIEKLSQTSYGAPTYYEILVALTYYILAKERVDYAVIETGLGGLLDGTNVVTREDKVAVITQIGHDHTAILGNTLAKIAYQKAGIIHRGNSVFTYDQHPNILRVIKHSAKDKGATLSIIGKSNVTNISLLPTPKFDFAYQDVDLSGIELNMLGSFQVQNCSLALAVAIHLSQRDGFNFDQVKVKLALKKAVFLGRMQQVKIGGRSIILDGAHNPQKMRMLVKNLKSYFPDQKFVFMVALKRGKSYKEILHLIVPISSKILLTTFNDQTRSQGTSARAEDTQTLAKIFGSLNFKKYILYGSSHVALENLLEEKESISVITGSLYLLSDIYPTIQQKL